MSASAMVRMVEPEPEAAPVTKAPRITRCYPRDKPRADPFERDVSVSLPTCAQCLGRGIRHGSTCLCVLRRVCDICLRQFHCCQERTALAGTAVRLSGTNYGRPVEEYAIDFLLCVKRANLGASGLLFEWACIQGRDWRECCQPLRMEKGIFFHRLYKAKAKVGRILREQGLFPVDEYFTQVPRGTDAQVHEENREASKRKSANRWWVYGI